MLNMWRALASWTIFDTYLPRPYKAIGLAYESLLWQEPEGRLLIFDPTIQILTTGATHELPTSDVGCVCGCLGFSKCQKMAFAWGLVTLAENARHNRRVTCSIAGETNRSWERTWREREGGRERERERANLLEALGYLSRQSFYITFFYTDDIDVSV
jgi:hypothetical protein